jgi:hypothetical protein
MTAFFAALQQTENHDDISAGVALPRPNFGGVAKHRSLQFIDPERMTALSATAPDCWTFQHLAWREADLLCEPC